MTDAPDSGAARPALVRSGAGRLVGGVATGISRHLGVNVVAVRVVFALLAVNGIGALVYLALWIVVSDDDSELARAIRLHGPRDVIRGLVRNEPGDDPHRRRKLIGFIVLGAAVGSLLGAAGIKFGGTSVLPLSVAGVGALLIWWRAPEAQRAEWTREARHYTTRFGRRGPLLIILGGIGLVVIGVTSFLAANDALAQARAGALAIAATFIGVLLVTGPWLWRLFRELSAERRARIREQERAEVAAHVHDSVLQTLALLQAQASDPDAVRRLARRQERELREWLYPTKPDADAGAATFASALRRAAADVEDTHAVSVDVVVVGDAALDESLVATIAAAREGMVNAAKSSGAPNVSVFAEIGERGVEVFVRDRGRGFDPDRIPADRRGIRESIVGRMTRNGGKAAIRSGPAGTEVALTVPRQARA